MPANEIDLLNCSNYSVFYIIIYFFLLLNNLQILKMAKSKNHTAHNQSRKAHRGGIRKVSR